MTIAPGDDVLSLFLAPVASWFRASFGAPTPPQAAGWPAIARGENALILAPTGSGKTLAAFLACLDHLWRAPRVRDGVRILYISPLKALNQDIHRNLQVPLEGIVAESERIGPRLKPIAAAIRTGDTPASERAKQLRRPPELLITTPESLHLLLTSRSSAALRNVTHVIVDEIHALCPNKRGVFLAILLERLEAVCPQGFVRIGLSATQRPLEEVSRYLGGQRRVLDASGAARFEPRPVTVVDAGRRKELDLEVQMPGSSFGSLEDQSYWPAIERRVFELVREHKSTIVFANNRRVVERLTAHLNALAADTFDVDASSEVNVENKVAPLAIAAIEEPGGADQSDVATSRAIRSHHGSLSLDERRGVEEALKAGEIAAAVATASLELGIDMGSVDLVCQVESPGSVSRGLQRVGRAGHVVGASSKGRLIAKSASDLLETAALCRAMLAGQVEELRVPTNCLDLLAQQIVACAAVGSCSATALFDLFRGAYPYRRLTPEAFESALEVVSGRFPFAGLRDFAPRVSWDRVHNEIHALPGTSRHALTGGGAIPDTGNFPVYLGAGGPRLGELDEEFVFERRAGESFVLGANSWRIDAIEPTRVLVSRAEGGPALTPFWRGEVGARTAELGAAVGRLTREIAEHLDDPGLPGRLRDECRLDAGAARRLRDYVSRQIRVAGAAPDDRTVVVEAFRDPAGELGLAILTPFGGKLNHALKLIAQGLLRDRYGIDSACMHTNDGVLIRLPQVDEPPLDLLDGLTFDRSREILVAALSDSALFGVRFRQNASRALLMPRPDPSKRTPLWLQRLRAKDLLQAARRFPDFAIVVETYRESLADDLDLPGLKLFLDGLRSGAITVAKHVGEAASPFASELVLRFMMKYIYEWDEPRRPDTDRASIVDEDLLAPLLAQTGGVAAIDPDAARRVEARLRGLSKPPRTVDEAAETLRRLGDLAPSELHGSMRGFLEQLEASGRVVQIELAGATEPSRWIGVEDAELYGRAFDRGGASAEREGSSEHGVDDAAATIVRRFLSTRALAALDDVIARYPIGPAEATEILEKWSEAGVLERIAAGPGGASGPSTAAFWGDRANLLEARRLTVALRRREFIAVAPECFADFVARRQRVHASTRWEGPAALPLVLERMQGFAATAELWERVLLPSRMKGYQPARLDETLAGGAWVWRVFGDDRAGPRVAFIARDFAGVWPPPADAATLDANADARRILEVLRGRGALFATDVARVSGLEPSRVRSGLRVLMRSGWVSNDRFDPVRAGADAIEERLASASAAVAAGRASGLRRGRIGRTRRVAAGTPEGRWSLVDFERDTDRMRAGSEPHDEESALAWATVLLDRYGVLARETSALEPGAPPWRELYPWLDRAELRGELRRGFFVEGLSGVQFATSETADELSRHAARPLEATPTLLSTLDPANLYGSGAPFDVELLDGGTRRLTRARPNSVVLTRGRPVLIIEGHGKRLTGLPAASEDELRAAVGLLPSLVDPARRILKVETWNGAAALDAPGSERLLEVGFVRDPPGLAYYAVW